MFEVEEVKDEKRLDQFVELPYHLYKSDPNWVPPLRSEVKFVLNRKKNPFWHHSTGKLYIAIKDREVVGRIAAIIDNNYINFHNEKAGYFGFFESINDYEVARALFNRALDFSKSQGMERVYGPMNPSTNDEVGFLLEGFDTPPFIMMTHTHRYYLDFAEQFGFRKARDLYAHYVDMNSAPFDYLERLVAFTRKRLPGLVIRPIQLKLLRRELELIKEVYNSAWEKNWGFVPMTDEEFDDMAKRLKPLVVPELVLIAELNGNPVGVSLGVPNYNEVLSKLNGRLGPIEVIKFLYYRKKIRQARIMIMGVKKEYRQMGIETIFFLESFKYGKKAGYKGGELSWVLEDNYLTNRAIEKMGGRIYKKYRIYQYEL